MHFVPATDASNVLSSLLTAYYREGEDADTTQEELDAFIAYLRELLEQRILWGEVAFDCETPVGFVIYAFDVEGYPFSECPGMGTIAEICVCPAYRQQQLGQTLVARAEDALRPSVTQLYVCAHASAQAFWEKCGYRPNGNIAGNGLPICIKTI